VIFRRSLDGERHLGAGHALIEEAGEEGPPAGIGLAMQEVVVELIDKALVGVAAAGYEAAIEEDTTASALRLRRIEH